MALTTAFGTMGATPSFSTGTTSQSTPMTGSTPAAKALNNASTPFNGGSTPNGLFAGSTPPPAPTQPIASQVHTDASGNSVKTTYQTPETGMLNSSSTPANTQPAASSGLLNNSGTVIDNTTGQTAGGGYINPGNTGGTTPNGTTVDASGNIISPGSSPSTLSSITSGLINTAGGNAAIGQNAENIASNYSKQISDVGNQAAINEESVGGQGLLPTAMGRAQQIAQTANTAENALASGESAALQGTGQQLTANSNATTALNAAGGLSTPSNEYLSTSYGNQVLDANGQPVGGTGNALSTAVQNAIAQIKNGSGYANAASTLSAFGPAGTNALLSALGPSFNINSSDAEAAAAASNINTQGTLNTTIGATGAQQATQNYVAAQTAYQTASSQATNLQNTLASTGINNNPQFVNQKINALTNQLGSANYASFITALNETKQAYTNLLSSVGASTPTVNGQQATDIFNENSTPAQINAAIDALNTAAYAKLQPLYEQIGTYSNIGASNANSSSTANPWH